MHMFIQFLLAAALRHARPKSFRPAHNPTLDVYTYGFTTLLELISAHCWLQKKGRPDRRNHQPRYWSIESIIEDDYTVLLQ